MENPTDGGNEHFDDVIGELRAGRQSVEFCGSSYRGAMTLSYKLALADSLSNASFSLTIDFEKWRGFDVRRIPYFNKISKFVSRLAHGGILHTQLEVDGDHLVSGRAQPMGTSEFIHHIDYVFSYTAAARAIAKCLNVEILFDPSFRFTHDHYRCLVQVERIIDGRESYTAEQITSNPLVTLIAETGASNIKLIQESSEPCNFRIVEQGRQVVEVFGRSVELPPRQIIIERAMPKIDVDPAQVREGDSVKVELEPAANFWLRTTFGD